VYESQVGERMVYVKCSRDKQPVIENYLEVLGGMSSACWNKRDQRIIEKRVSDAIVLTQGPMARL